MTALLMGPPESKLARRRAHIAQYIPPVGAIVVSCHRCNKGMWLGPKQQAAKSDNPEMQYICTLCILPDIKAGGALASLGGVGGAYTMTDGTSYGSGGQN